MSEQAKALIVIVAMTIVTITLGVGSMGYDVFGLEPEEDYGTTIDRWHKPGKPLGSGWVAPEWWIVVNVDKHNRAVLCPVNKNSYDQFDKGAVVDVTVTRTRLTRRVTCHTLLHRQH